MRNALAEVSLDDWLSSALHDLCQPLTALECRLVLGTMGHGGKPAEPEQMRAAIDESLIQCERLMAHVRSMQDHLTNRL